MEESTLTHHMNVATGGTLISPVDGGSEECEFMEPDSLDSDESDRRGNVSADHRLWDRSSFRDGNWLKTGTGKDAHFLVDFDHAPRGKTVATRGTSSPLSSSSSSSSSSSRFNTSVPITTNYLVPSGYDTTNIWLHFARLRRAAIKIVTQSARKNTAIHEEMILKLLEIRHLLRHEYRLRDRHNRLKRSKKYKYQEHLDSTYTTPKQQLLDRMLLYPEHFQRGSNDENSALANSNQIWDGTQYKLNLLTSLERKITLKKGWLGLVRTFTIRKMAYDMYVSTIRSKNAILLRVLFDSIIHEGVRQRETNVKDCNRAAFHHKKFWSKKFLRLLRRNKDIEKVLMRRVNIHRKLHSDHKMHVALEVLHGFSTKRIRLFLMSRWGSNHNLRMTMAKALMAWTVVLVRAVHAKRIAMEHENLLRDMRTSNEIEDHNQQTKQEALDREMEIHFLFKGALRSLALDSLYRLPRLIKDSSEYNGRYSGQKNREHVISTMIKDLRKSKIRVLPSVVYELVTKCVKQRQKLCGIVEQEIQEQQREETEQDHLIRRISAEKHREMEMKRDAQREMQREVDRAGCIQRMIDSSVQHAYDSKFVPSEHPLTDKALEQSLLTSSNMKPRRSMRRRDGLDEEDFDEGDEGGSVVYYEDEKSQDESGVSFDSDLGHDGDGEDTDYVSDGVDEEKDARKGDHDALNIYQHVVQDYTCDLPSNRVAPYDPCSLRSIINSTEFEARTTIHENPPPALRFEERAIPDMKATILASHFSEIAFSSPSVDLHPIPPLPPDTNEDLSAPVSSLHSHDAVVYNKCSPAKYSTRASSDQQQLQMQLHPHYSNHHLRVHHRKQQRQDNYQSSYDTKIQVAKEITELRASKQVLQWTLKIMKYLRDRRTQRLFVADKVCRHRTFRAWKLQVKIARHRRRHLYINIVGLVRKTYVRKALKAWIFSKRVSLLSYRSRRSHKRHMCSIVLLYWKQALRLQYIHEAYNERKDRMACEFLLSVWKHSMSLALHRKKCTVTRCNRLKSLVLLYWRQTVLVGRKQRALIRRTVKTCLQCWRAHAQLLILRKRKENIFINKIRKLSGYYYKSSHFTSWYFLFIKFTSMRVNEGILFRRRRRSVLDYYLNRFFSSYQYSKMLRENALVVLRKYCLTLCRRALGVMSAKQKTRLILRRAFNIREYAYSLRRTFVQVRDEAFFAWRAYAHASANHKKAAEFRSFFLIAKSFVFWTISTELTKGVKIIVRNRELRYLGTSFSVLRQMMLNRRRRMIVAINYCDMNFKQWLIDHWRLILEATKRRHARITGVIHTSYRTSKYFDHWRDAMYQRHMNTLLTRYTQQVWYAWKRSFVLHWKLSRLVHHFSRRYRLLLLSSAFKLFPGYNIIRKGHRMRRKVLRKRQMGGNAIATLVQVQDDYDELQKLQEKQKEELESKLLSRLSQVDPHHIRFNDKNDQVNDDAISLTLHERAELLGILHEGYPYSRLLEVLEAVFAEWRKAASKLKSLSIRYWKLRVNYQTRLHMKYLFVWINSCSVTSHRTTTWISLAHRYGQDVNSKTFKPNEKYHRWKKIEEE